MGRPGRDGVQEIGHRTHGVVEAFPVLRTKRHGIPAVHTPRDGQGVVQGVLRNLSLHPGGEDLNHGGVVAAVEHVLHPPEVQCVMSVVQGP